MKTKNGKPGPAPQDAGQKDAPQDAADPVRAFERMTEVAGRAQQMMLEFWTQEAARLGAQSILQPPGAVTPAGMATARLVPGGFAAGMSGGMEQLSKLTELWAASTRAWAEVDRQKLTKLTGDYWTDALMLWSGMLTGRTDALPAAAEKPDRRFAGEAWSAMPVFDLVRRSYLLASHYVTHSVDAFEGLSDAEREKLRFQARQFVDAMSPANFAALNPEVMAEAQATRGESLVTGLQNMLTDLKRGRLTMTDEAAFEVGRNVATTPGEVVFECPLFQLIQYTPTTAEVHEIPLLIISPWINKFYILDLTPEKSFIHWALEQGLTVFVISWAQGSEALRDMGFENYAVDGELAAIDRVLEITGAPAAHVIGYCVAGTVLSATLAYMAATGQAGKVRSATFLTAQVDFTDAGDLLNFVDAGTLDSIEKAAREQGFVDGRWLSTAFNLLRPTDLMWNYVVNNYLKGREYTPFDLLYWNSDPTHVPGRFMVEYLGGLYRDNRLAQAGGIRVKGVPIDLATVHTPAYVQAGRDDHIAPAASCFKLTRAFGGETRFMLAGSGHIAGVVNPPAARKYQHWTLPDGVETPASLDAFRAAAVETKGSWWPDWIRWLVPRSGPMVPARVPGTAPGFPALEPAPGRYVKERIV